MELFEGVSASSARASRAEELAGLPLFERLERRIVDGERNGLEADLDEALLSRPALEIINDTLLSGMKTVGELFGSGPDAAAVRAGQRRGDEDGGGATSSRTWRGPTASGKGTIVLATVKGDVHDIGKNLVDIILTNNGYNVVNLGIKQPISTILSAADEHRADAVGHVRAAGQVHGDHEGEPAGDELPRGAAAGAARRRRAHPLLRGERPVGGLRGPGRLRPRRVRGPAADGRDDGQGARRRARGGPGRGGQAGRTQGPPRAVAAGRGQAQGGRGGGRRPDAASAPTSTVDNPLPAPPFWGTRVVRGVAVAEYAGMVDERALFLGQWGLRGARGGSGPSYEELVETEGRPRLRYWLERLSTEGVLAHAARGLRLLPGGVRDATRCVVLDEPRPDAPARYSLEFPRQRRDRHLCLADFWRPRALAVERGEVDVLPLHLVTMGQPIADYANELFAKDAYRDYLEVHGLGVQLTEALAEYWHRRIREELTFPAGGAVAAEDPADVEEFFKLGYRGARYSLGYGACPNLDDRTKIVELLQPGADRRGAVRGAAAAPGAVHRRDGRPPPGGEVLQRRLTPTWVRAALRHVTRRRHV